MVTTRSLGDGWDGRVLDGSVGEAVVEVGVGVVVAPGGGFCAK